MTRRDWSQRLARNCEGLTEELLLQFYEEEGCPIGFVMQANS